MTAVNRRRSVLVTCVRGTVMAACLIFTGFATVQPVAAQAESEKIEAVLDNLHRYASEADYDRYFALFAEDAIYMGSDATERWTLVEFKEYTQGRFADGTGWTYTPTERYVYLGPSGDAAWFDERLTNATYGEARGTGALVKVGGEWKLAHYNLTFPIPNALLRGFVDQIRARSGGS